MTAIDDFEIPDNLDDLRAWYANAADQVAMLDGDNLDGRESRAAHRELAAARKAMEAAGLKHGGPR